LGTTGIRLTRQAAPSVTLGAVGQRTLSPGGFSRCRNGYLRSSVIWASIILTALGAIYLALLVGYFGTQGFVFPPPPFVRTIGGIVTILSAPAILVIFAVITQLAPPEKAAYATAGLSFAGLFVAMVSINRFVQLTVVRLSPPGAPSADLARFLPYSADSVMFSLEILGWGFFLSLATFFVAPLFSGARLQRAIRWLLVVFGLFSFMSVIGFATATPITAAGFVAWGPVLLALAILWVILFKREAKLSVE
jgi:hypothetical protein